MHEYNPQNLDTPLIKEKSPEIITGSVTFIESRKDKLTAQQNHLSQIKS